MAPRRGSITACLLFFVFLLLPSHGDMPRFFIDALVQSQSKVVEERRSGTRVCLVGCMHFNPFSTLSARRIAWNLLENQTLKAVVLEMFDDRWHRMLRLHAEGELRLIFDNEMQAVAEIANSSAKVPITFADLSDEELDVVFDEVLNETSADLQKPFSGWKRIWDDLVESFSFDESSRERELRENHQSPGHLNIFSLFLLLLASPIALLRNILVLVMEAPFSNTAWLLLIFLTIPALLLIQPELWQTSSAAMSTSSSSSQENAALWNAASLLLMLPMLVVWRVLLRAIIKERDAHLAENIRKSCDGTPGTVLVVLGSLHVPGVSRLLRR